MPKIHAHMTAYALITLGTLAAWNAAAQEEERWYRVELILFSQPGYESNQSEQWPAIPALAYPVQGRFLVDPQRIRANLEEHQLPGSVDAFGRQILAPPPAPDPGADPVMASPAMLPLAVAEVEEAAGNAIPVAGDESPEPIVETLPPAVEPEPLRPTPFVTLPAAQREFAGKAAYMRRHGSYVILFHEAWLQPVSSAATAVPIVIDRSGDTGNWPPLQGSIRLYLSRYLHLETNLWLNTRGDYLPAEWRMPPPPLGPPSLIVEQHSAAALENPDVDLEETALEPSHVPVTGTLAELKPVYPYRHAVLLQDRRRMRSNEVHYIDHPMLGVVARLTPLSAEELETLALAETDGSDGITTAH